MPLGLDAAGALGTCSTLDALTCRPATLPTRRAKVEATLLVGRQTLGRAECRHGLVLMSIELVLLVQDLAAALDGVGLGEFGLEGIEFPRWRLGLGAHRARCRCQTCCGP